MYYIHPEVAQLASTLLFNFIDSSSNTDGGEKNGLIVYNKINCN